MQLSIVFSCYFPPYSLQPKRQISLSLDELETFNERMKKVVEAELTSRIEQDIFFLASSQDAKHTASGLNARYLLPAPASAQYPVQYYH